MYLQHYRLKLKPFEISPDPNFLWLGEKHKEALASLEYGIMENKGFMLLTGDYGTGKTTVVNALANRLEDNIVFAQISDPPLEELDFFNLAAEALQMNKTFDTKGDFLIHFSRYLKNACSINKEVVLVIEEAQRTGQELIEQIRLLSNIEKPNKKLLTLIFVGQNEFKDTLKKNRALRQRFTIVYHIEPLTESETEKYILHRLSVAGSDEIIFVPAALDEIFAFSEGIPRLINTICDLALLTGYSHGAKIIGPDIIRGCAANFGLLDPSGTSEIESSKRPPGTIVETGKEVFRTKPARRKKAVLASAAAVIVAGFFGYFYTAGGNYAWFTTARNFLKKEIARFTDTNSGSPIQKTNNIVMSRSGSEKSVFESAAPNIPKAAEVIQADNRQPPREELNSAITELENTKARVANLEKVASERTQLLIENEEKLSGLTKELEREKKSKDLLQTELTSKAAAVSVLQGEIKELKSELLRFADEIKNSKKVIQALQAQLVDKQIPEAPQALSPAIVETQEVTPEEGAADQTAPETPDPADIIEWVIKKKAE